MSGDEIVERKKRLFIVYLSKDGRVNECASRVGWHRRTAYYHRYTDPAFKQRWNEAMLLSDEQVRAELQSLGII